MQTTCPVVQVWVQDRVFGSALLALNPRSSLTQLGTRSQYRSSLSAMSHTVLDPGDICITKYIITHVISPLQLPDRDHGICNDHYLAKVIATAVRLYGDYVGQANIHQWNSISRMLENLQSITRSKSLDGFQTISQFSGMEVGGKLSSLHSILEIHNV